MAKLTDGISRFPRYTGLDEDQKYFLTHVGGPGNPTKAIWSQSFGRGKSATMYMHMLKMAQKFPGIEIWFGRKHYEQLKKNNLGLFWQIVPRDVWKYKVYGGQKPQTLVFPNKSIIQFMGFNDPNNSLGGVPGAAYFEECSEIDLEVWNYMEGRVRQPNIPPEWLVMVGVGNPRGHYPLYRKFVKGEGMAPGANKDYLWMKGDPMGNKKNLPEGYYERMLASYPKELRERFVLGNDDTHAGQVYPQFNREIHANTGFNWQDCWVPFVGMDWGKTDPTVVLLGGFDPYTGEVWIIAEHYAANLLVPDHIPMMNDMVERVGFPLSRDSAGKWADSNIGDKGGGDGKSIQDWFADGGWYFNLPGKRDSIQPGIEKIQQLLCPKNGEPPRLHIHPRCTHTIEEFQMYEWATPKNSIDILRFKDEPRDDYNHTMDALRYMIGAMPVAQQKETPRTGMSIWEQIERNEEEGTNKAIIWQQSNRVLIRPASEHRHPLIED